METYHSVEQVAERYGVGKKVIYCLIHSGELRALQIGKKILRVSETELRRWEQVKLQSESQDG
ncbi:helix-turn-helix domain-containing protein [Deinococcus sp. UYEF24]|jgi:excisionase family DNA binding protein